MDLSTLDLKDLKALYYDLMVQKELIEKDLFAINSEIAKKANEQLHLVNRD